MPTYPLPTFRLIIWDADGTLYDSPLVSIQKHREVAQHLGLRVPTENELKRIWHKTWKEIRHAVWGADADRFKDAYMDVYETLTYPRYEGLAEAVLALHHRGIAQAVLTNRDAASCATRLGQVGLPQFAFSVIDGIEDRTFHKPDPRSFDRLWSAIAVADEKPEDAVYVGDTLSDWEAAREFGCHFIGVTTYVTSRAQFRAAGVNPEFILKHPRDILRFF